MKKIILKKIIPVLIILLIIMIIIISVVAINLLKKNNNINTTDPNGEKIIIENSENTKHIDTDSNDVNNEEKVYQEINFDNYEENNYMDNKTFRIQDVIHNNNGTITVKGRVYQYLELPSNLSNEEYKALIDGKSLNILGEKVTKVPDNSIAEEAGYEIALKVETKKYNHNIYYYASKNEDGTASLYNGSESSIAEGTDIYMQTTLNGDFECIYYEKSIPLKDYYKNDVHIEDVNKTRLLHKNNEFVIDEESGELLYLVVVGE